MDLAFGVFVGVINDDAFARMFAVSETRYSRVSRHFAFVFLLF